MLHIKWMSTQNSLYGTNRIQLAKEPVALSLSMEESAARLAGNGVRPSGVLSAPNVLNKESRERLTEALKQTHGGSHNHGGILLADGGLRWDSMRMSNVDAEFLATRMFQVAEIARYFRGPLHKLGIIEANQSGPSMIQSDQTYINEIVQRIHKTFDLDDTDYFVEFDYESFLKADITSRLNALRVGVLGSLFTINEARDRLGLQSVPDGDDILQPSNMVPLGTPPAQVGSGPGSDNTGAPAQDGDGDPSAAPRSEAD
jgi:HK97 family phage portal protein